MYGRLLPRWCVLTAFLLLPWQAVAEGMRIALLPIHSREATLLAVAPLVSYLQHHLGEPVELSYYSSYPSLLDALDRGELTLAIMGSLPYVDLRKRNEMIVPVVFLREKSGEARYRCAVIAFAQDRLTLANLRGKKMALTQRLSTCGYLGTNGILRQAGLSLEDTYYSYLDSHEAAALAVVSGQATAAGVKESFAEKYALLGVEILGISDYLPALGLYANRQVMGDDRLAKVREIMLSIPSSTYMQWSELLRYGVTEASDTDLNALLNLGDIDLIPPAITPPPGK
jgi:phosphonate transport system substrate-binding protein